VDGITTTSSTHPVTEQAAVSAAWLASQRVYTVLLQLATIAILARHLDPSDFGLVALLQVMLSLLAGVGYGGITTYIICAQCSPKREANAAFWVGLCMSALGLALFVLARPIIQWLSPNPLTIPIATVAALTIVIGQLRAVPEGLLKRNLKYNVLVKRDIVLETAGSALQVVLALSGFGVWSLVAPNVLVQTLRLVLTYRLASWYPTWDLGRPHWSEVMRFAGNTTGTNLLGVVANDGDTILVGSMLGTSALGLYNAAWRLANLPGRYVTGLVTELALPVFSRMANDPARYRSTYDRTVRAIAAALFPVLVAMFVMADDLIALVYGEKWVGAVLPTRVFILFTLQRVVMAPIGALALAKGRPEVAFRFNACFVPFYLLAIWFGSAEGLVGVAAAVTVTRILGGWVWYRLASEAACIPTLSILRSIAGPLSVALATAAVLVFLGEFAAALGPPLVRVTVLSSAGAAVYGLLMWLRERELVLGFVDFCRPFWSRSARVVESHVS
jgi:O-antigen/teichoic acid export membrane protein